MRKMKDSGVKWIGKIPETWKLERLQWCLQEINERNDPIKTTQILSLTNKLGVLPYEDKGNQGNKAKEDLTEYKIAYDNTLIVNSMNVIIGSVGISHYAGCVSPVYYVFRETEKADLRFVNYIFQTHGFQKELRKYANGILEIRLRISSGDLFKRPIPLPSLEEQKQIADYLDWQCSEVDAVLEKTRSSIEEYKHLKQAVITQAVTKGVRGDRPMKESGIEWVDKIPQEIQITRVGMLFNIILGKMLCSTQVDNSYTLEPYYCAADVHFDGIAATERKQMWFSPGEKDIYLVKSGDLLVVEGGAGAGGCAIVANQPVPTYIQNSIMIVRPKEYVCVKYLRYWIEFLVKQGYIDVACNKATIPHFTKDKLAEVPIPAFSAEESEEIAAYLDEKCAEIDALIAKKEQLLTELETYKKSLIYEYVTGKKEAQA